MLIRLEPGDRVVTSSNLEGDVIVITEQGYVYRIYKDSDGYLSYEML